MPSRLRGCRAANVRDIHDCGAGHCVFDYRGTHQIRDPHPRFWPGLNNNQSRITPPQVLAGGSCLLLFWASSFCFGSRCLLLI